MTKNFKITTLAALILIISVNVSFASELEKGPYQVCFKSYETYDHSRPYLLGQDTIPRPLLIHLWYPSGENTMDQSLTFKNYMDLIALREDFGRVSTEVDDNSFNYVNAYSGFAKQQYGLDSTITTEQILNSTVLAKRGLEVQEYNQEFPLLIYAPSNSKSSVQNHMICEFLASHGFMIVSVGSAGPNSMQRADAQESTMAQVTDMESILKYAEDSLHIKYSNLGLFGFSSGGLATSIFQMRNKNVNAVFSMDGGHEYGSYLSLFKMEEFDLKKTNVPYCLVVNNYENFSIYPYYNSVITTEKKMFRMQYLDHNGFVSHWRFFESCSPNPELSRLSLSYDYLSDCALAFFNKYLKPGQMDSDEEGFNFPPNEYIEPVVQTDPSMAKFCNLILTDQMDVVMKQLNENQDTYGAMENDINILSKLVIDHYIDQSIELLLYNVANHPNSWQAHYNLGFAYKEKGETLASKNELLKAHELNPENSDIAGLLEELNQ